MKHIKSWLPKALVILHALSLVFTLSATQAFAEADAYPSKPVRLVVPIPPGSSVDQIGRILAGKLSVRLGQQIIVDNRGGAGGSIGADIVARSNPDGYTLLEIAAFYPINAVFYKNLPFDPVKSFTPIAKLGSGPSVLVAHPSVPANSVKELIALAKQKPGKLLWATSGIGSNQHMAAELFKVKAGVDILVVNFKGGGPALMDMIGGHSQIATGTLSAVLPYIKSGQVKVLANCGLKRSDILPDVPTASESGLPGYEVMGWYGILAPAGTPAPIVNKLSTEIKAVLSSEELKTIFKNFGSTVDYLGPREFGAYIQAEIKKWGKVLEDANIKRK